MTVLELFASSSLLIIYVLPFNHLMLYIKARKSRYMLDAGYQMLDAGIEN
jgi:hypothetical protein